MTHGTPIVNCGAAKKSAICREYGSILGRQRHAQVDLADGVAEAHPQLGGAHVHFHELLRDLVHAVGHLAQAGGELGAQIRGLLVFLDRFQAEARLSR